MPTLDDHALVLDHHRFKDRHLIVAALTAGHGLMRGVLRSARGGKAPLAGSVQVLSKIRLSFFRRPQAELATINRVDLLTSSFPLTADLGRSAAAAVVAELLISFCPLDEPAPRRYRLGCAALDALLDGADPDLVVAYVEFWVLRLGGLMPPLDALDGDPSTDDLAFLVGCRSVALADLDLEVPETVSRRLDEMALAEADRPLRALRFYRLHGGPSSRS